MKSFEPGYITHQPVPPLLVRTIRLLGEFKGKETLFKQQTPQVLETLRQVSVIQSTESSNRIEGIVASSDRLKQLVEEKTAPRDRSEQEIAGYRDVLNTIHANHPHIRCMPNIVLQLHRDLYKFTPQTGGRWKMADNEIVETRADGSKAVRFNPVHAHLTSEYMEHLCIRFNTELEQGEVDPLLLVPAYVLDFLCIHPFVDGNGRMARLLSLLLLYQAGYEVGRYISLEKMIESQREGYYDALYASSQDWHDGRHSLLPWWEYFLGVMMLGAYREFEERVNLLESGRGAKRTMVLDVIGRMTGAFTVSELTERCPTVSIDRIRQILREESKAGHLACLSKGRDAKWTRI